MIISITKLKEIPKTCSECHYIFDTACCARGIVCEIKNTDVSTERWICCPLIEVNNDDLSKIIEGGNE